MTGTSGTTLAHYNARAESLAYYFRQLGLPLEQQPWLATVWRKEG